MVSLTHQSEYVISVDGKVVSGNFSAILRSLQVALRATGETSSARIELDDTGGQIAMPEVGKVMTIALGWKGDGVRIVFDGTVDDVRSTGGRDGRMIAVTAKGFDAVGAGKSTQNRHWDNATVKKIVTDAAKSAGLPNVKVDPDLADEVMDYWAMLDETLMAMGQKLAQEIGGHFRITGDTAIMSSRGAEYSPLSNAFWGQNLISWNIVPAMARVRYGTVRAPWFDRNQNKMRYESEKTGLKSDAVLTIEACSDQKAAKRKAKSRAKTMSRDSSYGSVKIDGDPNAVVDGKVVIVGARTGVDGSYRIKGVTHQLSRGAGFTTDIEIGQMGTS